MKKKLILTIALAAGMLTSCNMDLSPIGLIDEQNALETLTDATGFRNSMYVGLRGFTTSQFFTYSDIQTDMFNGIIINGNRMGTIANGELYASDGDVTGWWATLYSVINNVNYFLEYAEPLQAKYAEEGEEEKAAIMARYIGEAHFVRGYYYATMFDRWCQVYDASIADQEGYGLPIVTVYDPTSDRSKYPGRSSMNKTVEFFQGEMSKGLEAIEAWEALGNLEELTPNACYLSSYAMKAMQARVAVWLGDWTSALEISQDVIDSGIYSLCTTTTYPKLWSEDKGTEVIFMPYESSQELGSAIGTAWISSLEDMADYIPTPQCIANYEAAGGNVIVGKYDIRYESFLATRNLSTSFGKIATICFNKFPGNTALQTSSTKNIMNKSKTFRLSEMYLIAAEAAYNTNDNTTANKMLNALRKARIRNYTAPADLTGNALLEAIQQERCLELIGEGHRLSDLRRWKMGFSRANSGSYTNSQIDQIITVAGLNVVYTPNDHRYTWPIPSDEISCNPQIANQQNPGY